MSEASPTAEVSSPEEAASSNSAPQDPVQNASTTDRMVLEYLRARGHNSAERALMEVLENVDSDDKEKRTETPTVSTDELVRSLAVYAQKPSRPGENVLKDSTSVLQELTTMGNPTNIQNLIASIGAVGAEEILALDPTDKQDGFTELEAWVDGSLDMYKVCGDRESQRDDYLVNISLNSGLYFSLYFVTSTWTSYNPASGKQVSAQFGGGHINS